MRGESATTTPHGLRVDFPKRPMVFLRPNCIDRTSCKGTPPSSTLLPLFTLPDPNQPPTKSQARSSVILKKGYETLGQRGRAMMCRSVFAPRMAAARRAFHQQRQSRHRIHTTTGGEQKPVDAANRSCHSALPKELDSLTRDSVGLDVEIAKRETRVRAYSHNGTADGGALHDRLLELNTVTIFIASMCFGGFSYRYQLNQAHRP